LRSARRILAFTVGAGGQDALLPPPFPEAQGLLPLPLRVLGVQAEVLGGFPLPPAQTGEGQVAGDGVDEGLGLSPGRVVAGRLAVDA